MSSRTMLFSVVSSSIVSAALVLLPATLYLAVLLYG